MLFSRASRTPEDLEALFEIVVGTAAALGENYFNALTKSMAKALRVQYAFISVFTESDTRMRMLSLWNGEQFMDLGEYDVSTSPCREVMKGTEFFCPKDVQDQFPDDPQMKMLGAQSYRGVPMIGATGHHFGHIGAIDTKPIRAEPRFTTVMQVCATRAAAEMERVRAEQLVRASERRLDAVLHSTRDAIVTIDAECNIVLINGAAERMLGVSREGVRGAPLADFFSDGLRSELTRCTSCLTERSGGDDCLWLRDGLTARRTDGSHFPVEVSIAPVELDDSQHYTLVVRDIDERVRAQSEIARLSQRARDLSDELSRAQSTEDWIGESETFLDVLRQLELVSSTETTVLLTGESGTGKELAARMVHAGSKRHARPLVKVDCASLPESLIESELFGHEKGAFTGAAAQRSGRFELADGGTVFLDEIGELPLALQSKLLRVLEDREFQRVGGEDTIRVDVRIVAATNRDLRQMVADQTFREDLFFRLSVFPIEMLPLRDRPEDIRPMAEQFLAHYARQIGRPVYRISDEDLDALTRHSWPGNVRELKNVIQRSVIVSSGATLDLDVASLGRSAPATSAHPKSATLRDAERQHVLAALERSNGVIEGVGGAAAMLDIHPSTLRNRMRKLGIR